MQAEMRAALKSLPVARWAAVLETALEPVSGTTNMRWMETTFFRNNTPHE
jgi:hypothetical protein